MAERKLSLSDYGIDPLNLEKCPVCENNTLVVDQKAETWHCDDVRSCGFRGRLRNSNKATIMNAHEAAPMLERWFVAGTPEGMSWGWGSVDELMKMVRGEWSFIIGHTSHGKSHFVDAGIVNVCDKGWKVAMYSPENTPYERHVKGLIQKFIGKRFRDMSLDELRLARVWMSERVYFVEPVEPTFEAVLAQFVKIVREKRVQVCIIDPWNEVDHAIPGGMNETQYVAKKLIQFRRFCEAMHVHGIIVAHPAKSVMDRMRGAKGDKLPLCRLTDASGSMNFANKCDFGVSLWRNTMADKLDDQGYDERHVNHVFVLKARNEDLGHTGVRKLIWDPKSTAFYNYGEQQIERFACEGYKEELDRKNGGPGTWVKAVRTEDEAIRDDLKIRPVEWQWDAKLNYFVFAMKKIIASVAEVKGPTESSWYAAVKKIRGANFELLAEDEFPLKEDALDWCERKAMENG